VVRHSRQENDTSENIFKISLFQKERVQIFNLRVGDYEVIIGFEKKLIRNTRNEHVLIETNKRELVNLKK
jgi:hypothetical protein